MAMQHILDIHEFEDVELQLTPDGDGELGAGGSKLQQKTVLDLDYNSPVLDEAINESYVSCQWRTVQPAESYGAQKPACLLVLRFVFHPKPGHRFSEASVNCQVRQDLPHTRPVCLDIFPEHSFGGHTNEQKNKQWNHSLQVGEPTGHASATSGLNQGSSSTVDHFMVIRGSKHGSPYSLAKWDLSENRQAKAGIPHTFLAAMVVSAGEPFLVEVDVEATIKNNSTHFKRTFETEPVRQWRVKPTKSLGETYSCNGDLQTLNLGKWFSGHDKASQSFFEGAIMKS